MYIRFGVSGRHRHTGVSTGVFRAAYALRDDSGTPPALSDALRKQLRWFDDNLPAPADYGKYVNARAAFWFRVDAQASIEAIWKLARLMHEGGCCVRHFVSARPGKIVYQDDYQVAAIPFRDSRRRL